MYLPTREARYGVLKSGMETGVESSYKRLDTVLSSMTSQTQAGMQRGATRS
jgi:hypothetical protein